MVKLIKNDLLKIEILKQYKKRNISYTASILADFLNSKFETVKKALEFFLRIGVIEEEVKIHGKIDYTYYNLADIGKALLRSNKI